MISRTRLMAIVALILLVLACGLVGGPTNQVDVALIRAGIAARQASPLPTEAGIILNLVGGVAATLGVGTIAAVLLWFRGRPRRAVLFAGVVVGGRLLIEVVKLAVHRARPALDVHPVATHSLSFPSAHAGNSMIAFTALALFFAPSGRRTVAVLVALLASALVGASRSLIGVHWPSDVVAGWALGAAWILAAWPIAERLTAEKAQHDVVGGHPAPRIEA